MVPRKDTWWLARSQRLRQALKAAVWSLAIIADLGCVATDADAQYYARKSDWDAVEKRVTELENRVKVLEGHHSTTTGGTTTGGTTTGGTTTGGTTTGGTTTGGTTTGGTTTGGTTTGGTTTGGTTTGGTTTGGTTTGGTTTGGTTTGGTTTGGGTTYRTIFAQTDVNQHLLGWQRCSSSVQANSGGSVSVLDNSSFAYSGRYCLQSSRPSGTDRAMRLFVHGEYTSSCQRSDLPLETYTTFMVRIPQNYTGLSWLSIYGFKQEGNGYNESTAYVHFGSSISGGLRLGVQGRTAGAAGTGPTVNFTQQGANPNSPNTGHGKGFPINQWVKIDFHIKHSTKSWSPGNPITLDDGYVKVYQNGELIIHYIGRTMRENAPRVNAQLVNYGTGPATTIYFDNFKLMTTN